MKLYTRPGNDLTDRLPLIVEALALAPPSQIIDGEAVAVGTASFERIVSKGRNSAYRSGRSPDWIKRSA